MPKPLPILLFFYKERGSSIINILSFARRSRQEDKKLFKTYVHRNDTVFFWAQEKDELPCFMFCRMSPQIVRMASRIYQFTLLLRTSRCSLLVGCLKANSVPLCSNLFLKHHHKQLQKSNRPVRRKAKLIFYSLTLAILHTKTQIKPPLKIYILLKQQKLV